MAITRAEVNTDVNNKIRNKTTSNKVDNVEDADNRNLILNYIDEQVLLIPGVVGPSGPVGPAGPSGPVGPAGLNWQGPWDQDSSYAVDDAVGWNGASWFCVSEVNTASNPFPDEDITHWALLASQGAPGPQGPAGPSSPTVIQTNGAVAATVAPYPILEFDINTVYNNGGVYRLPQLDNSKIGKTVIVTSQLFLSSSVTVKAFNEGSTIISTQSNGSIGSLVIQPGERYRLTYNGNDYWIAEYVWSSKLKINGLNFIYDNDFKLLIKNPTTAPLDLAYLNSNYPHAIYHNGFSVACPSIVGGGKMYVRMTQTEWVSNDIAIVT